MHLVATDEVHIVLESISHWPSGFTLNTALFLATATREIPHFPHDPLEHDRDISGMVTLNVTSTVGRDETFLRQGIHVQPKTRPVWPWTYRSQPVASRSRSTTA